MLGSIGLPELAWLLVIAWPVWQGVQWWRELPRMDTRHVLVHSREEALDPRWTPAQMTWFGAAMIVVVVISVIVRHLL